MKKSASTVATMHKAQKLYGTTRGAYSRLYALLAFIHLSGRIWEDWYEKFAHRELHQTS